MRQVLLSLVAVLVFISSSWSVRASSLELVGVDTTQLKTLISEFAANSFHTTASPPISRSIKFLKIIGAEFGVLSGVTLTPGINDISKQEFDWVPHLGFFGGIALPYGIGAEIGFRPEFKVKKVESNHFGGAGSWTITDVYLKFLPVKLGAKFHYMKDELTYKQTVSGMDTSVELENRILGFNITASGKLLFLEPYLGIGFVRAKGDMTVGTNMAATFFSPTLTVGNQADADKTSLHWFGGLGFSSGIIKVGGEYSRVFDTSRFAAKLSIAL